MGADAQGHHLELMLGNLNALKDAMSALSASANREHLRQVFWRDGYWFGTDGACLLWARHSGIWHGSGIPPDIKHLLADPGQESLGLLSRLATTEETDPRCPKCLGNQGTHLCPDCGGVGALTCHACSAESACSTCDGLGESDVCWTCDGRQPKTIVHVGDRCVVKRCWDLTNLGDPAKLLVSAGNNALHVKDPDGHWGLVIMAYKR